MVDRRARDRAAARARPKRGSSRPCASSPRRPGIGMPEVAIYEGAPNAFATGAFKNSALVAVSTGLLQSMNKEEVEAVLGHEIAHVANGDMVTLTLIQGVVNTFVVFLARDHRLDRRPRGVPHRARHRPRLLHHGDRLRRSCSGILASMIVAWFSRQREFRADAGSAQYLGTPSPMVNALRRLGGLEPGELPKAMSGFGITDKGGVMALFVDAPADRGAHRGAAGVRRRVERWHARRLTPTKTAGGHPAVFAWAARALTSDDSRRAWSSRTSRPCPCRRTRPSAFRRR